MTRFFPDRNGSPSWHRYQVRRLDNSTPAEAMYQAVMKIGTASGPFIGQMIRTAVKENA